MKIVKSNSVEGISAMSYYTETMTFINTSAYSMHLGLSLMVYGETLVILVTNLGIIMLIWKIDKTIGAIEKVVYSVFIIAFMAVVYEQSLLTDAHWSIITSSTIFFNIASRVPQIW